MIGTRYRIMLTNVCIPKKNTKMTLHSSIISGHNYGSTNFDRMLPGSLQLYKVCSLLHILHRQVVCFSFTRCLLEIFTNYSTVMLYKVCKYHFQ